MHGRLVGNILLVVEEICAVDLQFGHDIHCPLNLQSFMTLRMSVIDVDLECGVLISSTSYSGFCPNPVQP